MPQQHDNTPLEDRIFAIGSHNLTGLNLADVVQPAVLAKLAELKVGQQVTLSGLPVARRV